MEILLIILIGIYFLTKPKDYSSEKLDWKINRCSKGEHFVGESADTTSPFCEVCGEYPRILKSGGWRWN